MKNSNSEEIIAEVSEKRRAFLRKAVKAGFVVPVIATFSMSGLMGSPAAMQYNMTKPD